MDPTSLECYPSFVSAAATPAGAKAEAKLERCVSPLSQASTAPPTPGGLGELPRALFGRSTSESEESGCSGKGSEEASLDDLMQLLASPADPLEEYLVDNSKLQAATIGLAYRYSKRVQDRDHSVPGPCWGTTVLGIDQGDGWLKAGDHFLPMALEGVPVLAAQPRAELQDEALWDGPSLTPSGRAVDLTEGGMLFFAHAKELSLGYEMACLAKEEARLRRSARLAHAACEAEERLRAGEACSVDARGAVRGAGALAAAGPSAAGAPGGAAAARRRLARRRAAAAAEGGRREERLVLCADAGGKVSLYLPLCGAAARAARLRRKRAAACGNLQDCIAPGVVLVATAGGCIQGWRRADAPPPVIPAPGPAP